jgi:hypothetical protein
MDRPMVIRSLAQTLRATASELAELTSIADHLQRASPPSPPGADARPAERAQLTELLALRVAGLTAFFDALALSAPPGVGLDVGQAAAGVRHEEQARRLCGLSPSDFTPDFAEAPGAVVALADHRSR